MSNLGKLTRLVVTLLLAQVMAACGGSAESPTVEAGGDDPSMAATDDSGGESSVHGGGHGASEQLAPPVEGAAEVKVTAVDIDFVPASLELKTGEPVNVTVTNDGQTLHDFTLEAAGVHVNVEPGETKTTSLTIDQPGEYEATCTVTGHAEAGMTIDVVAV